MGPCQPDRRACRTHAAAGPRLNAGATAAADLRDRADDDGHSKSGGRDDKLVVNRCRYA